MPSRFQRICLAYAAILMGCGAFFFYCSRFTPYDVDESGWTRASLMVAEAFLHGDLSPRTWEFESAGAYGNPNPPLAKYGFALAALIRWPLMGEPLPKPPMIWDIKHSLEVNLRTGNAPPAAVRDPLRFTSALVGLCVVAAWMAVVHKAVNPIAAAFTGVLLGVNPWLVRLSTEVIADIHYALGFVATLLAALWWAESDTPRQLRWRFRLAVLAVSAATAVKMAGALVLMPFLAVVGFLLWRRRKFGGRRAALMSVEALVIFTIFNVAVHPYLWPDLHKVSWQGLRADWRLVASGEYEVREGEETPQWLSGLKGDTTPGIHQLPPAALEQLRGRMTRRLLAADTVVAPYHPMRVLPSLYEAFRPGLLPVLYLRWNVVKAEHTMDYKLALPDTKAFLFFLGWGSNAMYFEPLFALAGIAAVGWVVGGKSTPRSRRMVVLLAFTACVTGIIYLTRITDSERYLFPIYLLRSVYAAIAFGLAIEALQQWRPRQSP